MRSKTEIEKEYEKLCKDIAKRENFLERIDNRDVDPDYTVEQQIAEDKKIERYEKELVELKKQLEETIEKLPKDSIYQPFSDDMVI